jgi:hypothetical protein
VLRAACCVLGSNDVDGGRIPSRPSSPAARIPARLHHRLCAKRRRKQVGSNPGHTYVGAGGRAGPTSTTPAPTRLSRLHGWFGRWRWRWQPVVVEVVWSGVKVVMVVCQQRADRRPQTADAIAMAMTAHNARRRRRRRRRRLRSRRRWPWVAGALYRCSHARTTHHAPHDAPRPLLNAHYGRQVGEP